MTRIVAGSRGGRRLAVPPGDTRPTSEKVREAMGSALAAIDAIEGARVLDLYAGSGAVGIELLSRGAAHAVLVEHHKQAAFIARKNLTEVTLPGEVVISTVDSFVAGPAASTFDIVFIDPPYDLGTDRVTDVLLNLADNGFLNAGAMVIVERRFRDGPVEWPNAYEPYRDRRYGDTALYYATFGSVTDESVGASQ